MKEREGVRRERKQRVEIGLELNRPKEYHLKVEEPGKLGKINAFSIFGSGELVIHK